MLIIVASDSDSPTAIHTNAKSSKESQEDYLDFFEITGPNESKLFYQLKFDHEEEKYTEDF